MRTSYFFTCLQGKLREPDDVRLVLALARTARSHGAAALSQARAADYLHERPSDRTAITGAARHLRAEVVYAAASEGAQTLADVLERRLHLGHELADRGRAAAAEAAALAAGPLGQNAERFAAEVSAWTATIDSALAAEQVRDDAEAAGLVAAARVGRG